MADYCQVCFSWTTEGDFHDVIDYGIQQTEQTDSDRLVTTSTCMDLFGCSI